MTVPGLVLPRGCSSEHSCHHPPTHLIPALQDFVVPDLDSATVDVGAFLDHCPLVHSQCLSLHRFLGLLCDLGLPILHLASSSHAHHQPFQQQYFCQRYLLATAAAATDDERRLRSLLLALAIPATPIPAGSTVIFATQQASSATATAAAVNASEGVYLPIVLRCSPQLHEPICLDSWSCCHSGDGGVGGAMRSRVAACRWLQLIIGVAYATTAAASQQVHLLLSLLLMSPQ